MKKPTQRKINSEITKMLRSYEELIADLRRKGRYSE